MNVFAITPASPKPLWFLSIICAILAFIFMALVYTAYAARNSRIELKTKSIKLVGDFWGRETPYDALNVAGARVLDLSIYTAFAPKRRTFGTGLPGYASGWFRLQNGEKALLYLTNRRQVAYVPTFEGYALLLSVEHPENFIERLQQSIP